MGYQDNIDLPSKINSLIVLVVHAAHQRAGHDVRGAERGAARRGAGGRGARAARRLPRRALRAPARPVRLRAP